MLNLFSAVVKRFAAKVAGADYIDRLNVDELEKEISQLRSKISYQDGDIAFAQSILARYAKEVEELMRENAVLRFSRTDS